MTPTNTYQLLLEQAGMRPAQAYQISWQLAQASKKGDRKPIDCCIEKVRAGQDSRLTHAMEKVGAMAEQDRVGGIVQRLIEAVQTARPEMLREVILWTQELIKEEQQELEGRLAEAEQGKKFSEIEELRVKLGCSRKNYVNDGLVSCMGFTALHVACGNYALHAEHRSAFNQMVKDLLKAGANPWLPAGRKMAKRNGLLVEIDPGMTVAQACKGNLPPALVQHFASKTAEPVVNPRAENQKTDKRSKQIADKYASSMEELDEYFGVAA